MGFSDVPDHVKQARIDRGLLAIAEWVNGAARGTHDPGDWQRHMADVEVLRQSLAAWTPPAIDCGAAWDEAVRTLCQVALDAHDARVRESERLRAEPPVRPDPEGF